MESITTHTGTRIFQSSLTVGAYQKKPTSEKKLLTGFSNLNKGSHMPNQHAADKEVLGFYIPRPLAQRVRKAAKDRGLTITAFIEEILTHATRQTELTPEDYRQIAEATERALRGAATKRASRKSASGSPSSKKASE